MAKRALCVGINDYPGTDSDLSGCVNDANDWAEVLNARGYEVTRLLDGQATRQALVEALTNLVSTARAGDSLVFTFSGHGSWLPDDDGDEPDGRDEMLCPYDINNQQYLMDDDLAKIFSQKPKDVLLYFISDSCHSGSVARYAADPLGVRQQDAEDPASPAARVREGQTIGIEFPSRRERRARRVARPIPHCCCQGARTSSSATTPTSTAGQTAR